jgi:hypothetical protein
MLVQYMFRGAQPQPHSTSGLCYAALVTLTWHARTWNIPGKIILRVSAHLECQLRAPIMIETWTIERVLVFRWHLKMLRGFVSSSHEPPC